MKKKALSVGVGIALSACSFMLPANAEKLTTIQVCPAGEFRPQDGRPMAVPAWRIDQASAQRVIERFNQRATPLVIDYEHQTLRKEENGQPAPAAAWFRALEWREGAGLFAEVELTDSARQAIANREYLFFSPVFRFDAKTGEVLAIEMGAFTNTPAIDGMEAMSLRAAACFGATLEDDSVNEHLKKLLAKFGLQANTDAEAVVALSAHFDQTENHNPLKAVCGALGVDEATDEQTLVAACTALKTKADAGATDNPDPTKYAPVAALTSLQTQVTALSASLQARDAADVNALIDGALEDGRLTKGLETWARDLGKKDVAALNSYLGATKPLKDVLASQTNGAAPVADNEHGLTADEIAVCSNMGITQEDYAAAKKV